MAIWQYFHRWCASELHESVLGVCLPRTLEPAASYSIHQALRLRWQVSSSWRNNPPCRIKLFIQGHQNTNRSCNREWHRQLGAQPLCLPANLQTERGGEEGGILSVPMKVNFETSKQHFGHHATIISSKQLQSDACPGRVCISYYAEHLHLSEPKIKSSMLWREKPLIDLGGRTGQISY